MIFSTARAMQIAYLEEEHIEQLHQRESKRGYCFSASDIQELFGLESIKSRMDIPERQNNEELQAIHRARIEAEIERIGFIKMAEGDGIISALNLEKTHAFDWAVHHNRQKIVWEFSGDGPKKKGLLSRLASICL